MTQPDIGHLAPPEAERDAVHVAIAPVTACQNLDAGDHVGIRADTGEAFYADGDDAAIGIVDPFLKGRVLKGQRFWLFLYPGTVTSLRHDWTHSAFAQPQAHDAKDDALKAAQDRISFLEGELDEARCGC